MDQPKHTLAVVQHVFVRNPELSAQEIADKALAVMAKGEAAVVQVLQLASEPLSTQLQSALWDTAIDLHPSWERVGEGGSCRYIGKGRPGALGPSKLLVWLYDNHPQKVEAIKQQFEDLSESYV